jgi:hypothetical protein
VSENSLAALDWLWHVSMPPWCEKGRISEKCGIYFLGVFAHAPVFKSSCVPPGYPSHPRTQTQAQTRTRQSHPSRGHSFASLSVSVVCCGETVISRVAMINGAPHSQLQYAPDASQGESLPEAGEYMDASPTGVYNSNTNVLSGSK